MASVNIGDQEITFCYQQEGTAKGFNQLLNGILPRGIISGGTLSKNSNTKVNVGLIEMLIGDNEVMVHVKTNEVFSVSVDYSKPYVIARFNWAELKDNYVTFESCSRAELPQTENALILGKCEFTGAEMSELFDYTRKTWSILYYNNEFLYSNDYKTRSPSFNVTVNDDSGVPSLSFQVGKGSGFINGQYFELSTRQIVTLTTDPANENTPLYFTNYVINRRIDLAIIKGDGSIEYVMGEDKSNPTVPICPSYGLPLATFTFNAGTGIDQIKGSQIQYIFNNNYIGTSSSSIGKKSGIGVIDEHTLYL